MATDRIPLQIITNQPKHLWFLMLSYAMIVSISNWYDARLISIFTFTISPGTLIFSLSFLLSDIITEVYGYKNARRAIWAALFFNLLFIIFGQIVAHMPSPSFSVENNAAFDKLLTANLWIVAGSFISYLIAEPLNSYLISKLKMKLKGKYMGIRFIVSTIIAVFIDSILFIAIAFHTLETENLIKMMLTIWLFKSIIEILGLPLSIRLAKWLKHNEKLDIYDNKTDFNVFNLDVNYNHNDNRYN